MLFFGAAEVRWKLLGGAGLQACSSSALLSWASAPEVIFVALASQARFALPQNDKLELVNAALKRCSTQKLREISPRSTWPMESLWAG